jgi:RNA polymerase sigma-70 factor (ECF subfamily)
MASTSADDAELWRDWQGGDARAFESIVRRHTPRLLAVATRLMRDGVEAAEVVQEAYIAAWRGSSGFDGRAQLSTWLHRITINAGLARLRRGARRKEVSMEQAFAPVEEGGQGEPPDTARAEAIERGEVAGTVWSAIEALPDDHRTVLVLRDIEGLSSKEVAVALGISDASVRQRLHRARQTVGERLRPELCGADAITCGGRLDLLFDHLDGVLAADLLSPVGEHVSACRTCTSLASGYGALLAAIKGAPPVTSPARGAAVASSVLAALHALPR